MSSRTAPQSVAGWTRARSPTSLLSAVRRGLASRTVAAGTAAGAALWRWLWERWWRTRRCGQTSLFWIPAGASLCRCRHPHRQEHYSTAVFGVGLVFANSLQTPVCLCLFAVCLCFWRGCELFANRPVCESLQTCLQTQKWCRVVLKNTGIDCVIHIAQGDGVRENRGRSGVAQRGK